MKIKHWAWLASLTIIAGLIISTLIFFTNKPNDYKNGFLRKGLNEYATRLHETDIDYPLNRIAGFTNHHIFFSEKKPNVLVMYDWRLEHADTINFSRPFNLKIISSYEIKVDSPLVTIYAGNLSVKLTYRIYDTAAEGIFFKVPLFTRAVPISNNRLAIRAFDSTREKQFLNIADTHTGAIIKKIDILPDQPDGGFSTDGWLRYDSLTNTLLYVSIFSNSFYCLDSNLTPIYKSKTIDTINSNPVTTHNFATDKNEGSLKPATPLKFVNRDCCTSNGRLYVASELQADNENKSDFTSNTVIDIYDIRSGKYVKSFYIPNKEHKKLLNIRIFNDSVLVALYADSIGAFELIK